MIKFKLPSLPIALIPSAVLRINITYLWRHGRLPNLRNPRRFTELVQQRKLENRDIRMSIFADKVSAKERVKSKLGAAWVIPTLWEGRVLPDQPDWPMPFIVKARHGCNQNFICKNLEDWKYARKLSALWCNKTYGLWLDEWAYLSMERGIIIEPYLGSPGQYPVDYKFYVFAGKVRFVQVHLGRADDHRWILFNPDWRRVSSTTYDKDPQPPRNLRFMITAAEKLADNFDFVRVDMYEIDGKPLFGEMTFYPGSGLDPFDPPYLDITIGAHWLRAQAILANQSLNRENEKTWLSGEHSTIV